MFKFFAFTEIATPTCYIAGSRDSGMLTDLRPFTKLIDSNLDFGSFGVTRVKSSFLLKNTSPHTINIVWSRNLCI